jgi:histidinol-phosphate aminotransferase
MYVCNPNNPTGTVISTGSVEEMIRSLPDRVLVVVDEAYHHYVDHTEYRTLIPAALESPNLVVLRTFSKIYGLATHRVGVAIGVPDTLAELRKPQAPFSVSQVAQVAATASLGNDAELIRRIQANAIGRAAICAALGDRGIRFTESQTNFVFAHLGDRSSDIGEVFAGHGVIIRPISGGWARITVGTPDENRRFLDALDLVSQRTDGN